MGTPGGSAACRYSDPQVRGSSSLPPVSVAHHERLPEGSTALFCTNDALSRALPANVAVPWRVKQLCADDDTGLIECTHIYTTKPGVVAHVMTCTSNPRLAELSF